MDQEHVHLMCAKWRNGYRPDLILDAIRAIAKVEGEQVSYVSFTFMQHHAYLLSAVEFRDDMQPVSHRHLVKTGVVDALRRDQLNNDGVISAISRAEREHLKKPEKDYLLATSLSVKEPERFGTTQLDGHRITVSANWPKSIDRTAYAARIRSIYPFELPTDYAAVRITTRGRTVHEAVDQALRALSFLRGIWNFSLSRHSWRMSLGSSNSPANEIVAGPIHTLHDRDGSAATETIWYENNFRGGLRLKRIEEKKIARLKKESALIRRRVNATKDKQWYITAFMRYAQALDEPVPHLAFTRLWSVLEYLTDTTKADYDTMIRRAAFIWHDRDLVREELHHLRERRNRAVHTGHSDDEDAETCLYQLRRYVDTLLGYLISKENTRQTIQEVTAFLDMPHDVGLLDERLALFKKARRFRGSKPRSV